jgi:hypothetical protein
LTSKAQRVNDVAGCPYEKWATHIGKNEKYAGNLGNRATNPKAVSQYDNQYDNACAQAALHSQLP